MANIFKVKRSSVAGKVPLTTDLQLGELAVNTYDGKLYLKKNVGGTETIVDVSSGIDASGILALLKTVDGTGSGLDADLLDGQHGSYYLDWTNITNKPDPVITVTLTGDVTGSGNTTLTDLASGTVSFATTIAANSVALGTDTTGNYVATIAGTTNQITVSGSGSETAAVTLSLPQDIHNSAKPTFNGIKLGSSGTEIAEDSASTTTVASTTLTAIDSVAVASYRSAKYIVQITQGTNYQTSEVLIVHNGTATFMTEYAILTTNGTLGTISSDISGGNLRLLITMGSATSSTIKLKRTIITV